MRTTRTNINAESFDSIARELTIDNVKETFGRIVDWTHPVASCNDRYVYRSQFAEVISRYDYAGRIPDKRYGTVQVRWDTELDDRRIDEYKQTLMIVDAEGEDTFIRLYPGENVFSCSDEGRYVTFAEEDQQTRTEQTRQDIGSTIRQLRRLKGMTLKDLADKTGVVFNRIAEIEKGMYSPGIDVLTRVLSGLNAHLEVISEDTDVAVWQSSPIKTLDNLADYLNDSDEWPLDVDSDFILARGWEDLTGTDYDVCRNERELLTMGEDGVYRVVPR